MGQSRRFRAALCFALVAGCAWKAAMAQGESLGETTPSEKAIVQLIKSDDPRDMAWGAHFAYLRKSSRLNADLLTRVKEWQPSADNTEQRDGIAAELDALIQLHVDLRAETLRSLATDFPNYVALMLTRLSPEKSRELSFETFRNPPERGYSLQYVAAALLAKSPPAGFAAELLSGTDVRGDISVLLPDRLGIGRGMSIGDCMAGWGDKDDWPKFGSYQFSREKSEGAALLFSDPQPVYVTREESTMDPGFRCGGLVLNREDRRKFLAYMLRIKPEEFGWKTQLSKTIVYQSAAQVDFEVRKLIADEQEKYRATARQLVAAGLMDQSDAESSMPLLKLHWWLDSEGGDQADIVRPKVLPDRVEWSENPFD